MRATHLCVQPQITPFVKRLPSEMFPKLNAGSPDALSQNCGHWRRLPHRRLLPGDGDSTRVLLPSSLQRFVSLQSHFGEIAGRFYLGGFMRCARILVVLSCLLACAGARAESTAVTAAPESNAGGTYYSGRILPDGQMQVGRYTTAGAKSALQASDPLSVYARLSYPRQTVRTVGEALRHTLLRTGWSLVDTTALEPEAQALLAMPLPESQRDLGPYQVRTILGVLTGPSWNWGQDPIKRVVWFAPKRANDPRAAARQESATNASHASPQKATATIDADTSTAPFPAAVGERNLASPTSHW